MVAMVDMVNIDPNMWRHLPESIFYAHVLPHCSIDTRLAFACNSKLPFWRPLRSLPIDRRPPFQMLEATMKEHLSERRRPPIVKDQIQYFIPIRNSSKEYSIVVRYYKTNPELGGPYISIETYVYDATDTCYVNGQKKLARFRFAIDHNGYAHRSLGDAVIIP